MISVSGDKNQTVRRNAIMDLLEKDSRLPVTDLSDALNVSVVTVRKDLSELENEGLLKRIHGGAVINRKSQYSENFAERKSRKAEEKRLIAKAAAELVRDGESLIINVGSTCAYICEELKNKNNLIVITNALHIVNELACCEHITTFFLGGRFDTDMQITVGDDVSDQLSKYKADKLIMGMDGVDIQAGLTSYNHVEDAIMRQMIAQAKEKILVVDDSKIGKVTFAHIAALNDFDILVTNYNESKAEELEKIRRSGLQVIAV